MKKPKNKKTIKQRILNRFGIPTTEQVEQRVKEAYISGYDDGNDDPASGEIAAGGFGYRLASGGVREPSISWGQNLQSAWQLKQSNPLVDRSGEIKTTYIVNLGIAPKAVDPELQEILTEFWTDNSMSSYISELTRQWLDYGAQCVTAYVRQSDGRVRLGYIDPGLIERVITHPENAREMWAVVVKAQYNLDPWIHNTDTQVYRIVRKAEQVVVKAQRFALRHNENCNLSVELEDGANHCPDCDAELFAEFSARIIEARFEHPNTKKDAMPEDVTGKLTTARQSPCAPWEEVMLESHGLDEYTGDCFFIRKNADSNQTLGRSDHLQVADFCDQHDNAMWVLGERERLGNLVIGILRVLGDDTVVAKWQKKVNDWGKDPGTLLVVNESVTDFNLNSPNLQQSSSVATTDAQRKLVLGGEGIPDAWYGAPGGSHLATVTAQGDPTWRAFSHNQGLIQAWFVEMLVFVRDQAMIAGTYTPEPTEDEEGQEVPADTSITLPMPEMTVKDVTGLATALTSIVGAMSLAKAEGFVSQEDAIDATAKVLAELDVHPNVDELKDAIVNEEQGKDLFGDDGKAARFNLKSWQATHAALEAE